MPVARCTLESRQAIIRIGIRIGIRPFPDDISAVLPQGHATRFPITGYRALIDTGAQRTCLTNQTIAQERLRRHARTQIRNVSDVAIHGLFMASLAIEIEEPSRGYYGIDRPIEVINIANNGRFDAILGMDLLEAYTFAFDGQGQFELKLP